MISPSPGSPWGGQHPYFITQGAMYLSTEPWVLRKTISKNIPFPQLVANTWHPTSLPSFLRYTAGDMIERGLIPAPMKSIQASEEADINCRIVAINT